MRQNSTSNELCICKEGLRTHTDYLRKGESAPKSPNSKQPS